MKFIGNWLIAGVVVAGLAAPASADFVDRAGDILPTYTGPLGGDLDILRADVAFGGGTFNIFGTMAGPIGTTPGAFYVWGLDRGQGTARFAAGSPSVGTNVLFDSVVVVRPDGTGNVNDLITGASTVIAPSAIRISGSRIDVDVSVALLPSRGLTPDAFTWNLWTRVGAGQNVQIADFAPDNSNLRVSAVPEPASLAMLAIGGLFSARFVLRKRRPRS